MTNYDYTPVPKYVAPTQGNMQQAATEIANWLRTKGDGKDTRESLAQAVQLFGDVAAQFINEASGLKGQFNSAIAGANTNSEVAAARASTVSGTGYTTLGARLDAIDTEQKAHDTKLNSGVVDTSTNQDVDGVKNFLQLPTYNSGRSLLPASDTGWLSDGITWLNGCGNDKDFFYRVTTLGSLKLISLFGRINIPQSVLNGQFTDSGKILTLPSSAQITSYSGNNGNDQFNYAVGFGDNGLHVLGIRVLTDGLTLQTCTNWDIDTSKATTNIHINATLIGVDVSE
jgi:hypothetical protein